LKKDSFIIYIMVLLLQ